MGLLGGADWVRFCCCICGVGGSLVFVVSLTMYIVASITCGSSVIVTVPTFCMLSLGGFLGSSLSTPFLLCGFVQYFSNRPSLVHFCRDLERDSARTPLSPIDWKSFEDRSSPCASSTVGNGFPGCTDRGRGGGGGGSSTGGEGIGVSDRSRGVDCRRFDACSTRAAARAGSFLFFSMTAAHAHSAQKEEQDATGREATRSS